MTEIVEIKMREAGKVICYQTRGIRLKKGNYVIIEADKGLDYGRVISRPESVAKGELDETLKKIVRLANREDLVKISKIKKRAKELFDTCSRKIAEHKLNMKLVETEYSFDLSKAVFYFTAPGRVDFRNLVKDLAKALRMRIELCQIGVRDEAKLLGGFGPCGRRLCCAHLLKDFEPVTIHMAKEQNLPLNPAKISGVCGRLMCCLAYEHKAYKELLKGLPKMGEILRTKSGKGKVIEVNVLKRAVKVELENEKVLEVSYPAK